MSSPYRHRRSQSRSAFISCCILVLRRKHMSTNINQDPFYSEPYVGITCNKPSVKSNQESNNEEKGLRAKMQHYQEIGLDAIVSLLLCSTLSLVIHALSSLNI